MTVLAMSEMKELTIKALNIYSESIDLNFDARLGKVESTLKALLFNSALVKKHSAYLEYPMRKLNVLMGESDNDDFSDSRLKIDLVIDKTLVEVKMGYMFRDGTGYFNKHIKADIEKLRKTKLGGYVVYFSSTDVSNDYCENMNTANKESRINGKHSELIDCFNNECSSVLEYGIERNIYYYIFKVCSNQS